MFSGPSRPGPPDVPARPQAPWPPLIRGHCLQRPQGPVGTTNQLPSPEAALSTSMEKEFGPFTTMIIMVRPRCASHSQVIKSLRRQDGFFRPTHQMSQEVPQAGGALWPQSFCCLGLT